MLQLAYAVSKVAIASAQAVLEHIAASEVKSLQDCIPSRAASHVGSLRDTDFGEFVITSVEKLAPLLVPALGAFERQYPAVCLRYLTSGRLFRLEFG